MTDRTRRRFLKASLAAGLFTPALIRPAQAARRLTVASLLGPDKPETKIWHRFGEIVERELPGEFLFNVVPNAALGGEKEVVEGLRLGSVQASLLTVSSLAAWVPESQVLDLPFLFRDAGHLRQVLRGPIGAGLKTGFADKGFSTPGFINYGARHLLTKEPLTRPEQLAGKRMRVIQSPLHTNLWKSFGAVPAAIPITETYNALATGVVEAMDLTKSAYAGFRLYEVAPYLIETAHIWAAGVVCFSASFWSGLTERQKVIFTQAALEAGEYFDGLIIEDETTAMAKVVANGGKVLQPEERARWEAGAKDVWALLSKQLGEGAKLDSLIATIQAA